ncbi:MAG: sensor domain-containing protein [Actinomycetota bacterium]
MATETTPHTGAARSLAARHAASDGFTLASDELKYRALFETIPAIIYVEAIEPADGTIDISPQIEEILGFSREEWLADYEMWYRQTHPEDRDRVRRESEHAAAELSDEPYRNEYRMIAKDGCVVWFRDEAILVRDQEGSPLYWQGVLLDITELRAAEGQLRETDTRYRALVEQIPAIVYVDVCDEAISTSYVSPQIEALLGIRPEEYMADADLWRRHLHPDDEERALVEYLEGRNSGEPFTFEYRLIARDGRVVWFRDSAIVIPGDNGNPALVHGVMLDITERKKAEEEIAFLAYHDKLTSLPNRLMFEELLDLALARGRRHNLSVAVVSVDLDNFKLVNDSLGHEAGDELLRQLGDRLREATRETDLVARHGGDEFLLLLADLDREADAALPEGTDGAMLVAESVAIRIQEILRAPFELAGTEFYVSASIGISMFPHDSQDGLTLLKNADTAMYQSKATAVGGYLFFADQSEDALEKLSFTTRLRRAVENQNWTLHYQPVVNLAEGSMVGVEALLRWQDPNGGLIPPGEFIPLAEEMGLIEVIGDWVVGELARQAQAWRREGLELEVSFNLSPRQLRQPDVAERILTRLEAGGVRPENVIVEITESTAMTDPDRTLRMLRDLHAYGLRLAIDDFGTGYSSLARLKDMPVDILKIDRSFIHDVSRDGEATSMVRAIIQLAEGLGKIPLAEGIETEEEWGFLTEHGCTLGQGYFFSRPVPAADILAQHRRSGMRLVETPAS